MKVLVITPYYHPKVGGLENYARRLNLALSQNKSWEIVVVTSQRGLRRSIESVDGMKVYRLGTWFKLSNTPFNLLWPFMLSKIIHLERPNVLFAHAPVPTLADAAAFAQGKTPFILIYHAATLLKSGSPFFNLAARLYSLLGDYKFRRADRIFAVSDYVRDQFPAKLAAKTEIVPNSVWQSEVVSRPQPQSNQLLFVASLDRSHAWKGLSQIIEALALYIKRYNDNICLTVVGDGTGRTDYEKQAASLGIQYNVNFTGRLVDKQKLEHYRKAAAMVIYPTTENDAFPTVMLEAWAEYVPVISARIGALTSLISDGVNGFSCPPCSPDSLAETMHRFFTTPLSRRAEIAAVAARDTIDRYTWEIQAEKVSELVGALQ